MRCTHSRPALTRKEKAAMPEQDQAVRLVFFVEVKCISVESASHVRSFFCLSSRLINSRSRFDKFNHVKYTKTLSVRNRRAMNRLLFFASNAPNAHKASSIAPFLCAHRRVNRARSRASTIARCAFFVASIEHAPRTLFCAPPRKKRAQIFAENGQARIMAMAARRPASRRENRNAQMRPARRRAGRRVRTSATARRRQARQ